MKFIQLQSRGGNFMVVAENVAWLRAAENGQTQVGMAAPRCWSRAAWKKFRPS